MRKTSEPSLPPAAVRATARTPARAWRRLPALLLLGLPAACTVTTPIQPPAGDQFFGRAEIAAPAASATSASAEPGSQTTQFVGGLGSMIWEVDQRRLQLVHMAAEVTNGNTTYNALLWPLSALVLYSKLHTPSESLLAPAMLGAASYGLLSSGIPEREQHYLLASRKMACAVLASSAYLYRRSDIDASFAPQPARTDVDEVPYYSRALDAAMNDLNSALQRYRLERSQLLGTLQPRRGSAAPAFLNDTDRRRQQALGKGSGGSAAPRDPTGEIEQLTLRHAALAQDTLDRLGALRGRIVAGRRGLLGRWQRIEFELHKGLAEKAPPLAKFQAVSKDLLGARDEADALFAKQQDPDAHAEGQGARVAADAKTEDWRVPGSMSRRLERDSQLSLARFNADPSAALQQAVLDASAWLARDAGRRQRVKDELASSTCSDADLALLAVRSPAPLAAPAAAPASPAERAARPATDATPKSGDPLPLVAP